MGDVHSDGSRPRWPDEKPRVSPIGLLLLCALALGPIEWLAIRGLW